MSEMRYDALPEPGERYVLNEVIGTGVCAKVYKATDTETNNRTVAIKIQRYEKDMILHINEEYRVLRDHSSHPNLPDFYGVYRKKMSDGPDEIWFILEFCEGGPIIDIIRSLQAINKRMTETHLAYILRETAKAVVYLHDNNVIHRDIKGSNILMTSECEIKLCDFGLSRETENPMGKRTTCIGSPCWMAPEIVLSGKKGDPYDNRSDVWAFGVTAIELADGKSPFADIHPTRCLFQILRNPPPTFYRPSNWSQNFNDFVTECLEKNPDHRPFMVELMEHPFFTDLPSNDYHLSQEIKMFMKDIESMNFPQNDEVLVHGNYLKTHDNKIEKMHVEDLAALDRLTDETMLEELRSRYLLGDTYAFVGDVLLSINPNKKYAPNYDRKFHNRYMFKARSDNAPHIFGVADRAYQDMMHHEEQQNIVFTGETYSGKTTNMRLCLEHLCLIGESHKGVHDRIKSAMTVFNALTHAGTPLNNDSTRCVSHLQVTFGSTGKLSGLILWIYALEKTRVSSTNMNQSNFHIFYYFYDAMDAEERLRDFDLEPGRHFRYLRIPDGQQKSKLNYIRDDAMGNVLKFKEFEQALISLDFSAETLESIYRILAALLLLGEVRYKEGETPSAKCEIEDSEVARKVARLLKVDEKKFEWALLNYCFVAHGNCEKRHHTADQARDARDVLASTIYTRLVDYIINYVNQKLAFGRAVYGDIHSILMLDMYGFECFHRNHIEQLFVNSLNEQLQYQYNQKMFAWEMLEQEEESIPVEDLRFYDNKVAVDHLMNKPGGLFHTIDEASRGKYSYEFITDAIGNKKSPYVKRAKGHEFAIAHYTGKISYDARDLPDKNRDFLPPEMMETMRMSEEEIIKLCFTNQLTKTGNLTMADDTVIVTKTQSKKSKWGAALMGEKQKYKKMNTLSKGQYSQIHGMRTLCSVFRAVCLELMKGLSIHAQNGGTHFVRCMRADLEFKEKALNDDMIRQQMRAMAVLDTARARQKGYSHRLPFQEFLRRYQFLAFDFDENVEISKDNCRLLLIRLKMEGWVIGKSKVFLKYYNEEYLSRLYETQVKKIIKVQSMMRAFLAKRNIATKLKKFRQQSLQKQPSYDLNEEEAVVRIQKAYRGFMARKIYGPLINKKTGAIDAETAKFIEPFAAKWKNKSIYQVLLQYRSVKFQDFVNFSQQVHIYNQRLVQGLTLTSMCILIERIDPNQRKESLGPVRLPVWKIPFRLDEIPFFDTSYLCDPNEITNFTGYESDTEPWDAPMRRKKNVSSEIRSQLSGYARRGSNVYVTADDDYLVNELFTRDPSIGMPKIAPRMYEYSPQHKAKTPSPRRLSNVPSPTCLSPTPYSKPNVSSIRDRFSNDGNVSMMDNRSVVYKKRTAPKPPSEPFHYSPNHGQQQWNAKKRPAPQPHPRVASPKPAWVQETKVNPIKELEAIGKKSNGDEEEDSPPFNFQGMLRKTKYNRDSMKRTKDSKFSLPSDDFANNNVVDDPFVETSKSYDNVVFHSKSSERPKSCQDNIKPPVNPRKFSLTNEMSAGADENANLGRIKEEIAPGIVLEGDYVADL